MKVAVFQVVNEDIDGRGKCVVSFSSTNEKERDTFLDSLGNNKCYYRNVDTVLDLGVLGQQLINKLDGNDKMLLDLCLSFDANKDSLTTDYHDVNITCYEPKTKKVTKQ